MAAPATEEVFAFPASIAQQVFWYLELLQPGVTAFNVPMRFRLCGPLDIPILERTLNTIVNRHEALRTHFEEDNGELLQIVRPSLHIDLPVLDISHLPADQIGPEADRLGDIEAQRPFRLSTGPMIRAELVKLSAIEHILHVTVHHALFDGSSMTVLTRELAAIYQAYHEGGECPLDPPPIQYGDFSVWQKEFLAGPEMRRQLDFWKSKLLGMTEVDLPTDRPRPPAKSWKGGLISTLLSTDLTDRLQAIAARNGATLYHLLLTAYKILLHRYSGGTDISVGSPITGRTRAEVEPLIGVFINSLVLRSDLSGDPAFETLLRQVRDTALEAVENQDLPFECLVRELKPERDPSRNPLFQVNFTHQRSFAKPGSFGGVELTPIPSRSPGTIFDLHFFMVERAEGWRVTCDYSTDLFDEESARRMLGHFQHLLADIASDPARPISRLEILTEPESRDLTQEWAVAESAFPREADIGGLFLETARAHPQRTALVTPGGHITYAQLLASAAGIAGELIHAGVKPGDLVVLCSRPSPGMISGLLGILLAGGAYVPLDPEYPDERFQLLLDESGARHALIEPEATARFHGWQGGTTRLDPTARGAEPPDFKPVSVTADHPAYLLFTSGSTGRPKGVLVPHRGVVRLVKNCNYVPIHADDIFLQTAPLSFDASTFEIWAPLLNGGRLVLPGAGAGLDEFARAVRTENVSTLWLTSGLFQLMIEEHADSLKSVRHILTGGEVISTPHVRRALDALPDTSLIHVYGPTENTTFTTFHRITRGDLERGSIPIGRPISNTTVFILDDHGCPVPAGVPGELLTGGDGLATCYHGAPELTAEKFINHPQFGRLYKTGDICRWSPDGMVEFLGRRDHQVKVRGFRIEPGEIEAVLSSHPAVRQAKVAVRGDSTTTKRILAWIVPQDARMTDVSPIESFLAEKLPVFMRPDGIGVVVSFPVTKNGKTDIAALPDPGAREASSRPATLTPPRGGTEEALALIWRDLLGIPEIGRDEDFFALGGHSLMALRMFSRINREFGKALPLAALIQHPTISTLAGLLKPEETKPPATPPKGHLVTLAKGNGKPPLFCIHGGDGGVIFYRDLAGHLPDDIPLHAIESLDLSSNGAIQPSSVPETAASYVARILEKHPTGPFRIAGYSFGGVVAHAMACLLVKQGHEVDFLGLFDTHNPTVTPRKLSLTGRLGAFWTQNADLPSAQRVNRLRERFFEGIATNRRIRREISQAHGSAPAEAHSDLRRVQVREENWRAMQAFRPSVFPGRITLFKARDPGDKVEWPADYGWSAHASGLEILTVPGQHLTLFNPGNVGALAMALASSIPPAKS